MATSQVVADGRPDKKTGAMSTAGWLEPWWLPSDFLRFHGVTHVGLSGGVWVLEGVGVTGWSAADAEAQVLAWLKLEERPGWLGAPEPCRQVPEGLKEPHGSPLLRGVWYPLVEP
jgi:hypothetical protein